MLDAHRGSSNPTLEEMTDMKVPLGDKKPCPHGCALVAILLLSLISPMMCLLQNDNPPPPFPTYMESFVQFDPKSSTHVQFDSASPTHVPCENPYVQLRFTEYVERGQPALLFSFKSHVHRKRTRFSLSSDGNRAAMLVASEDGTKHEVRMFNLKESTWTKVCDCGFFDDIIVSSDGNRVAIASHATIQDHHSGEVRTIQGEVKVYSWMGCEWTSMRFMERAHISDYELISRVAFSSDGNRVAISFSSFPNTVMDTMTGPGLFQVYGWTPRGWIRVGPDFDDHWWSEAVAMSSDGNRVAILGIQVVGSVHVSGHHACIYDWTGSVWTQVGSNLDFGEIRLRKSFDDFDETRSGEGFSIALSADGNRVAIGAREHILVTIGPNKEKSRYNVHVRVYDWTGSQWTMVGLPFTIFASRNVVSSISLSADGNRLSVHEDISFVIYDWNESQWIKRVDMADRSLYDISLQGTAALSSEGNRIAIGRFNERDERKEDSPSNLNYPSFDYSVSIYDLE